MIEDIEILYKEGMVDTSIRDEFIGTMEGILTFMKLSGIVYDIFPSYYRTYQMLNIEINTELMSFEKIINFEIIDGKISEVYVENKRECMNKDFKCDLLKSLEIFKKAIIE